MVKQFRIDSWWRTTCRKLFYVTPNKEHKTIICLETTVKVAAVIVSFAPIHSIHSAHCRTLIKSEKQYAHGLACSLAWHIRSRQHLVVSFILKPNTGPELDWNLKPTMTRLTATLPYIMSCTRVYLRCTQAFVKHSKKIYLISNHVYTYFHCVQAREDISDT